MAKRNDKEFFENLEKIKKLLEDKIPGGITQQAMLIHNINKTILKDDIGRVYFNQYAVAMRRRCIAEISKGTNVKDLAEMFNVSEQTIRNDIKEYYQAQRRKTKVKGLNFIGARKTAVNQ